MLRLFRMKEAGWFIEHLWDCWNVPLQLRAKGPSLAVCYLNRSWQRSQCFRAALHTALDWAQMEWSCRWGASNPVEDRSLRSPQRWCLTLRNKGPQTESQSGPINHSFLSISPFPFCLPQPDPMFLRARVSPSAFCANLCTQCAHIY